MPKVFEQVVVNGDDHFVFRYRPGDESAVFAAAEELCNRADLAFGHAGAAILRALVTRETVAKALYSQFSLPSELVVQPQHPAAPHLGTADARRCSPEDGHDEQG